MMKPTLFDKHEGEILATINEILLTTNEVFNLHAAGGSAEKMYLDEGAYIFAKILINILEFKNIKAKMVVKTGILDTVVSCVVVTENGCMFNCHGQLTSLDDYHDPDEDELKQLNEHFTVKKYLQKVYGEKYLTMFGGVDKCANIDMLIHVMMFWNLT